MSTLLDLLNDGFFAAIAAIGFASISNPKRSTFWSLGLLAALEFARRNPLLPCAAPHGAGEICLRLDSSARGMHEP